MTGELWKLGASDLAAKIRAKEVKSREVVEALLRRIADVNPRLNAVTVTLDESALAAADAADRATAAGGQLGPLHGVPISVKENIDLLGSATTQGVVAMERAMPTLDAPHVAQLKAAGAIPFARTNLPDFGLRWHSDNALRGATKNPWDADRTPGGSSGGEAAALATGMTPLGLGNDYGGSLRWPSQCNGTAALKPTLGRVPDASSLMPTEPPVTLQLFAVQGPMARHVRDLRLAFRSMSGPAGRDPWYTPAPLEGPPVARRVAVTIDPGEEGVDPQVAEGVRKAARALSDAGYEVEEVDPPMVGEARDLWAKQVMLEVGMGFRPLIDEVGGEDAKRFLDLAMAGVPELDFGGYVASFGERQKIARAWTEFAERYPLILGPVGTDRPFTVGFDVAGADEIQQLLRSMRLVVAINLLGLPAVALPVGVAEGLPQGVQIIGNRYREDLCMAAAEAIEQRLGVITPIDPR